MSDEWVTMTEAAERLGIKRTKISRLASRGVIKTQDNPLDARVRLVKLEELRTLFEKFGSKISDQKQNSESEG